VFSYAQDSLWTRKADITYARKHAAAQLVDGKIYLIGGLWNGHEVEAYTIETDTWETKTSMPTPRAFLGSGVVDGKIYILGGAIQNTNLQQVIEMYDPKTDTWNTAGSLNENRFGMGSCVYENKIYLFGGRTGSGPGPADKNVEAWDPVTEEWISDLSEMPTARWEPECVLIDSLIYVLAGMANSNSGHTAVMEAYNPETDTWTEKASLPEKRIAGNVAAVNGKIYFFGGNPGGPPQKNVWEYDPAIDQWYMLPDMPFGWHVMSTCVVDSLIYLMAGSKVGWPLNDNFREVYTYRPDSNVPRTIYEPEVPDLAESVDVNQNIRIFPNPATNTLHIEGNNSDPVIFCKIFNTAGVLQKTDTMYHGSLDIADLDEGIYVLVLLNHKNIDTQKFMKVSH
jgi:N-acetylneuraminic acid mutarotase